VSETIDPRLAAQPGYWNALFKGASDAYRTLPVSQKVIDVTDFFLANGAADVVDVGCGLGRWVIHLARQGLRPTGVDIVKRAIEMGRRWAAADGLQADFAVASATALPFPDHRFDGYVGSNLLDHLGVENAREAVAEMRRVLRPGGVFFLSFDVPEAEPDKHETLPDGSWHFTEGSRAGLIWRPFSDDEIRGLLEGLEILDLMTVESGARWVFGRAPEGH
jgi:SAM-dependent methyltransferase